MVHGQDSDLKYRRNQVLFPCEMPCPDHLDPLHQIAKNLPKFMKINGSRIAIPFFVILGGRKIPGVAAPGGSSKNEHPDFFYEKADVKNRNDSENKHNSSNCPWGSGSDMNWSDFWSFENDASLMDLCVKHRLPVIYIGPDPLNFKHGKSCVIINQPLDALKFYKKFSAEQTFQEISMFLGGTDHCAEPPLRISDSFKVIQHGFDKSSFRKRSRSVMS